MILKILKYPEPRFSRTPSPVTEFNAELRRLGGSSIWTLYDQPVCRIAPQVGASKLVTVIDVSMGRPKLALINPEIIYKDGKLYEQGLPQLSRHSREGRLL